MAKNTGKPSEKKWLDAHAKLGKRAWTHRFVDASEIVGKTGKVAIAASPQPSDFMLVLDGETSFSEVKSTQNKTSFPFSILQKTQSTQAKMILAAGGSYWIYVHSLVLKKWFKLPYSLVTETKAAGKSSLKWSELTEYEWTLADG